MKRLMDLLKRLVASPHLALVLRLYIGVVFVYASMSKIPHPAEFAENLIAYRLFPWWSINILAVFVPWLELICGLFLVIGLASRAASFTIGAMLLGFTVAIVINLLRGSNIGCGCFEAVGGQIGWGKVIRDLTWLVMTLQVFFFDRILLLRRGGLSLKPSSMIEAWEGDRV